MNTQMFPDLVINGETIPQTAVAAELQNHTASKDNFADALRNAANALVIRTLLLQQARKNGIEATPQEVSPNRFETDDEAKIRVLLESEIDVARPTEEDIRTEWQKDPERFRTMPLWEVSHILCKCDPNDAVETELALRRATDILSDLRKGGQTFEKIARAQSDCGSRSEGGSLGQLRPGDTVPEFEAALRQLSEGEIAPEPVLSRYGYHVLRLDALAEGQPLPFEAVKPKISEAMEKAQWARKAKLFVDGLIASASITGADLGTARNTKPN
ncbi:peptidylprolyl isomerase [Thalassospira sp.]|uniref:peptidylprolyl isomerase n=1 Tax=Thalassospira sp. TaxID=1912094 RepID=UPI001B039B28|nr:peptidylprolyl isomerase [Thalassospira sp.]MBO6805702.1 peptidylprolyl isomerase [Thalassospira sp.]MBO6842185.1 peptidylprolyl isomerase [Thalassospira sp.]